MPTEELTGKGDWNLFLLDGLDVTRTIQVAGSNYPKFRVKMFGMSVGVVGVWAMSDVQVKRMPIWAFYRYIKKSLIWIITARTNIDRKKNIERSH